MRDALFRIERNTGFSIQSQIREMLVSAILAGQLPTGEPLPSSRRMAKTLGVSRNTVILAYQGLVDDGYMVSRERSGFYVNDAIRSGVIPDNMPSIEQLSASTVPENPPDWATRLRMRPASQVNLSKPDNWQSCPYPFIYGQVDQGLFPIAAWRECSRQALGRKGMDIWTSDAFTRDDTLLIEQIRTRLLPRRGIMVGEENILVTMGAQNALYMLASLLTKPDTVVGMEEPGYPDVRNIFNLRTDHIRPIPVDHDGLCVGGGALDGCDIIYTTPSHQFPTTVTLPMERRKALLADAATYDRIIVEDDYEFEANYVSEPTPALKSLDRDDRVIYVGSLSKTLFPGLRMGYVVAAKELIDEMRAVRRLMLRHPPNNNQRTTALFLSLGHYDSLVHKLHKAYRARWEALSSALDKHLPGMSQVPSFGGTSFWVTGPKSLDTEKLAERALEEGVVIEPGHVCFAQNPPPKNVFRLGFSSIALERIEPGIEILARLIQR
ncbi:MAG: PLP-dependent aminotransferase family protein [Rhodospirillales bacterium]|jgi:GntR family transcriptional regulator / MocR family aminotransferase|nr:PLP-dependent aminotransferase family protein [Rhodospirillales bacterium]MBT4039198.1 PLP-dependent aminotransferase family protein [Rhodospirillales bacterium]MBT4625611.1 PLP-dependent aminotransferase family protein [Rhodospirillales bacterium]MBT5351476.1 PLP-dependent aminotransferase family protein [Rhodospirillales bacterium]MBT5521441.1 PLP-dependent aminotransferase family protein [Rhodospirillales bacterium]